MRKDMNFFAEFSTKKKSQGDGTAILVKSFVAIVLALILATSVILGSQIIFNNIQISKAQAKLDEPEVKEKLAESDKVKAEYDLVKSYDNSLTSIVNAVSSRSIVNTLLINEICSTLPDVELTSINIDHSAIVIRGTTTSRQSVAELENNLNKIERVESTEVSSIAGDKVLTFDIKCVLKDVE